MTELVATRGLPGSGKSTWANTVWVKDVSAGPRVVLNRDDLRAMLHAGKKWSGRLERLTIATRDAALVHLLKTGVSVCVADTNLDPKTVGRLGVIAADCGADFRVEDFTGVDPWTCVRRDLLRDASVGAEVVWRMFRDHLAEGFFGGRYVPDDSLPSAVTFDMDGTLSSLDGRNPFDESTCDEDGCHEHVADLARMYRAAGYSVVVLSGRDEGRGREATERWLDKHAVPCDGLFMRAAGDTRPDWVVKGELLRGPVSERYAVRLAVDDRDQVVELWRGVGIPCLQTAFGAF